MPETDQTPSIIKENLPLETSASKENDLSMTSATTKDFPQFGWSNYAERINGRFAMIGFTSILLIELLSQETFLKWSGFIQ